MADATKTTPFCFWLWLIRIIGVIVPRRLRADWRQEWEAELRYRELLLADWDKLNWRTKLDLVRRSLGAFWDALLLQPQRLEDEMFQDLRFGLRMLLKKPAFTLIAVFTIALGVGANTAIFSVVNAALLRGLPYQEPERLVHLWEQTPQQNSPQREASYPDLLDWRQNQVFSGMAAYGGNGNFSLLGNDGPEPVRGGRVTANFFDVLGVEPILGRRFREGEDQPGAERVVLLTYSLWQQRYGGKPDVIGQTLRLNDDPHTVIGVLPPNFQFAPRGAAELWTPWQMSEPQRSRRFQHWVNVIARLKPGVSQAQAQAEMQIVARRIEQEHQDSHAGTSIVMLPLHDQIVGSIKPLLLVLLCAVGFVLLITCANVANLLLVQAAGRQKEIAIRAALGAGRGRLLRQMLVESLLLALLGGGVGLWLARLGVAALIAAIPGDLLSTMPYLRGLTLDGSTLAFTGALVLLTSLVCGLAPALQASQLDLQAALKEGGRSSGGAARQRLRSVLVVGEIALALVLLVGASLMMKSLARLWAVNPGFETKNLLTFNLALPATKYAQDEKTASFHQQLLDRLSALPGVKGAGTAEVLPLVGGNTWRFYVEGQPRPAPGSEINSNLRGISANYFGVMGIPLNAGRFFTPRDNTNTPPVVMINQTLASRAFAQQDPVGQRLIPAGGNQQSIEIVGVVADEKVNGLAAPTAPVVYYPYLQVSPLSLFTGVVVRTTGEPANYVAALRREVRALEPNASVLQMQTVEQIIANSPTTFTRRYPALLIGVLAVLALLLAALGIYGVISYTVSQQTHEIGIRLALGAQSRDVLKLVVGQGIRLTLVGLTVGLFAAFALTRLMQSLLFGISATDWATYAEISALLAGAALLACYLPARRATRVDPMIALRQE